MNCLAHKQICVRDIKAIKLQTKVVIEVITFTTINLLEIATLIRPVIGYED